MSVTKEINIITKISSLAGLYNVTGYIIVFFSSMIIARIIGPELYGKIAFCLAIINILQVVSVLGMDKSLVKYISHFLGKSQTSNIRLAFHYAIITSFIISMLIILFFFLFGKNILFLFSLNYIYIKQIMNYFIFLLPIISIRILINNSLNGIQKSHLNQLVGNNIRPILRIALFIFLLLWFSHIQAIIFATVISYTFNLVIIYVLYTIKFKNIESKIKNIEKINVIKYKEFIYFSIPLTLIPILNLATQQFDTLIVGYFLDATKTGVYAIVRRIGNLTIIPLIMFGGVGIASISKLNANNLINDVQKLYFFITKWITFFSILIFIFFFTASKELLLLFGYKYAAGTDVLKVFIIGQLVNASVGPSGNLLLILNKNKVLLFNSLFTAILSILLSVLFIPKYGLFGAGISLAITFSLVNIFSIIYIYIVFKIKAARLINYFYRICGLVFTLALTNVIKAQFPISNIYILLPFLFIIICVFLFLFIYIVEGFNEDDKLFLKGIFLKKGKTIV